ncbi:hypothetical protein COW80_04820 [Candidatus Beckwithbacteria bacterium CG22_combo_CG10-13_8_21_14_all_01_47_9]|uniref:Uncharacterized protein n=5 Tax=Candidatus Beckwithiibacteriota TaxID=1752726 RepID=A0A2H0E0Z1_9BACT|nr:MAG: hypothetical protein AUJ59_04240 [Candidatus Beckwithbacteria bacterium CG1_02_47_37]PIP51765.1 MAG: hypothetical protein COX09_05280 [Candidatus Beckwithbacteria bacterium CG23_combo_of_CG06-09_8_20_14_all_47_9]PIP87619.1 MAG: hypothetical protein COW80_04820 [Candidatus Beckwithbacteria bacterium CG22_combo_CG10-13_8_21_14_all_01_47_9]PJA21438.1 MAG: hypothetical protein COX59_04280 [Candidatus Beckwithbacteria bacterium CG_4_10_14_0_2_um_filter_47_25]PJC66561.1 MAG: hypothetical prot
MTYQVLTCPNCGGRGCPTCQNTGKVRVSSEQLQKIRTMAQQLGQNLPQSPSFPAPSPASPPSWAANLSGIIAWSILAILSGAAAASWYFLKSFKPFLMSLSALLTLIGFRFAWKQSFFKLAEPDDFLKAIKRLT